MKSPPVEYEKCLCPITDGEVKHGPLCLLKLLNEIQMGGSVGTQMQMLRAWHTHIIEWAAQQAEIMACNCEKNGPECHFDAARRIREAAQESTAKELWNGAREAVIFKAMARVRDRLQPRPGELGYAEIVLQVLLDLAEETSKQ